MLLKLEIPYIERSIQGGSIIKWHKAEGEWVNYGDDLVDLQLEDFTALQRFHKAQEVSRLTDKMINQRSTVNSKKRVGFMCLTSSDMGVLHKIHAQPGTSWKIGDLLAVLTTDEDQLIEIDHRALAQASMFRVVANLIET